MRISDWSSDVCSSDLPLSDGDALSRGAPRRRPGGQITQPPSGGAGLMSDDLTLHAHLIGRQSSRADLNTPVRVIARDAPYRQVATMSAPPAAPDLALRPHANTPNGRDTPAPPPPTPPTAPSRPNL